jgi:hypothetical protein
MFHLYIKDKLVGTYTSHKGARIALAKMRFDINIEGWRIVQDKV